MQLYFRQVNEFENSAIFQLRISERQGVLQLDLNKKHH